MGGGDDYGQRTSDFLVRCSPEESHFIEATVRSGTASFEKPPQEFRYCELEYEEARHVVQTIWWLNRVRSWPPRERGPHGDTWDSSGVGFGYNGLGFWEIMHADTGSSEGFLANVYVFAVSQQWNGPWTKSTFLTFATHILDVELPQHLGERWSRQGPERIEETRVSEEDPFAHLGEEERTALAGRLEWALDRFSLDERDISFTLVARAAEMAAEMGLGDVLPRLRAILERLPAPGPTERELREVIRKQEEKHRSGEDARHEISPLDERRWSLEEQLGKKGQRMMELRQVLREVIDRLQGLQQSTTDEN